MTVPGGCRSHGCHGYLLGSLATPFSFTRHLPPQFNQKTTMCNINAENDLVQSKLYRKFEKVVVTRGGKTIECGR